MRRRDHALQPLGALEQPAGPATPQCQAGDVRPDVYIRPPDTSWGRLRGANPKTLTQLTRPGPCSPCALRIVVCDAKITALPAR